MDQRRRGEQLSLPSIAFGGALGTELLAQGMAATELENAPLTAGPAVEALHRRYGAPWATTATFALSFSRLPEAALRERAAAAVALARRAATPLGDVGPGLRRTELLAAFREAGVETVLLETFVFGDALLAATEEAAKAGFEVFASGTFEHGETRDGWQAAALGKALLEAGADAVGANCGETPEAAAQAAMAMADAGLGRVFARPSAGLPDARGTHSLDPGDFAELGCRLIDLGIAVGGCCGVGPQAMAALRRRAATFGL